jgi:hypothetical protein
VDITTELRVRTRLADAAMDTRRGKVLGPQDYDVLLTGPSRVMLMNGRPLAVYLPGALAADMDAPGVYGILHDLRHLISRNRGLASGTPRYKSAQTRSYTRPISSGIIGAIDPGGQQKYCRLTSWTGLHQPEWQTLHPLFRAVASHLQAHVPGRYTAQAAEAAKTDPAWVIPGTPFTTITVNNTYPTGTHQDKGDLDAGYSTIAVSRRGPYTGGQLVFPQYRVAVNLNHGDLLLMDAHEWHGNVMITCACGTNLNGPCPACGAERISVVSYFRSKLTSCGSPADELRRADASKDRAETAAAARLAARRPQEGTAG